MAHVYVVEDLDHPGHLMSRKGGPFGEKTHETKELAVETRGHWVSIYPGKVGRYKILCKSV